MGCGQAVEVGHDARTSLLGQAALIAGPDLQSCHTLILIFAIWNTEQFVTHQSSWLGSIGVR